MKNALLILLISSVSAMAEATPAQLAEAHYRKGLAEERAGNPAGAVASFEQALKLHPNHANARYRLGHVRVNFANIAAKGREAKLGAVMVPKIELDGATLGETLEYLSLVIERESKGEVAPNFVIQDPTNKLAEAKISLQLKNVPAKAVLEYVTTMANVKIRFDEHAVVFSPR